MPSMDTSVASVVFQVRITLSPGLMLSGVAAMVAVGAAPVSAGGGGGGGGGACFLPHPAIAAIARTARQDAARRRMFQVRTGSEFTGLFSSVKNIKCGQIGRAAKARSLPSAIPFPAGSQTSAGNQLVPDYTHARSVPCDLFPAPVRHCVISIVRQRMLLCAVGQHIRTRIINRIRRSVSVVKRGWRTQQTQHNA